MASEGVPASPFGKISKAKLAELTREQKLELYDLLQEKRRRKKEQKANYKPNDGQLPVHMSRAGERYVFAANGGGKTVMAVMEAVWAAQGYNPILDEFTKVPARIIVLLDSPPKVDEVWLPVINEWFNTKDWEFKRGHGRPYVTKINFPNGSELTFMFQLQDPLAFESIEWSFLVADEPFPRSIYVALKRGGRTKGTTPRMLCIGTPIAGPGAWMRKDVYEPWVKGQRTNTECFRFSTYVNRHNLSDGYIEDMEAVLSEKERAIRLSGEFFDLEGLALAHLFKREVHLVKAPRWPTNWPVVVAIDPHPKKAHVACMLGVKPNGNLVYLKEISSRAVPSEFATELKKWYHGYRVIDIVCDSFGSSELTGGEGNLSFIRVLKDNGVRVRATTYDEKRDEAFIQMIQEVLVIPKSPDNFGIIEPRLTVVEGCRGIIENIESVEWERYKNVDEYKPRLAIHSKDFLATLKYALACQPRFNSNHGKILKTKRPVGWFRGDRKISGL